MAAVLNARIRAKHAELRQSLDESYLSVVPICSMTLTKATFIFEGTNYEIEEKGDQRLSHIVVQEDGYFVFLSGGQLFRYLRNLTIWLRDENFKEYCRIAEENECPDCHLPPNARGYCGCLF